jgi:UDP-N-acetylmuramoylalanine--D-glutamate ligase
MHILSSSKNVLVIGYGISGKAASSFLKSKGHNVSVFDDKTLTEIPDVRAFDVVVKSPSVPVMGHNRHCIIKQAMALKIPVLSTFDVFRLYNPEAKIIAVTGTNGKSTTTALIYHILKDTGFSVQIGGNIGISYFDLQPAEWYVFEMSSYELVSSNYLDFEVACVLNIEPDHMEFHGSFENYIEAKHLALDNAKLRMVSADDPFTMKRYGDLDNVITVSTECNYSSDVYICEGTLRDKESDRLILDFAGILNLRGKHNHQNIEFAYIVCKRLGVTSREILKSLHSFTPLPHRTNIVKKIGNVTFVNDSKATNPPSASKALSTFIGYKIYWLVGGRSKKIDSIPYVKPYLAEIQKIYLFGESMDEFESAFQNIKETVRCQTMLNALNLAFKDAKKEVSLTVILLSPMCASFDQFDSFEHRGNEFVRFVEMLEQTDG